MVIPAANKNSMISFSTFLIRMYLSFLHELGGQSPLQGCISEAQEIFPLLSCYRLDGKAAPLHQFHPS